MGRSKGLLAATVVATSTLPGTTVAEGGIGFVSASSMAPFLARRQHASSCLAGGAAESSSSSQWTSPLHVPRGGAERDPVSPETGSESKNSKKKRRKKKTSKSETEDDNDKPGRDDQEESEKDTTTKPQTHDKTSHDTPRKQSSSDEKPDSSSKPTPPQTLPIVEEILKEDDYYRILGITRAEAQSNPALIKKSYRRRALQTHPDKTGGDRRAFDKVAEAYEILSDEDKRKVYNRHGKKGLHGAGPGHGFPTAEDLFRSFFDVGGGGRGNPFQQPARRNRTMRFNLEVTLEDLYQGMVQDVSIGAPDGRADSKKVQVNVPRGAMSGQSIRLHGAMDFDPEDTPGDLVFSLHQRPHRTFRRKGHDLAVAVNIGLDEALNGVTRTLRHLDDRSLTIASARDAPMIQSGDVHVLKGQGMPKNGMGTEFGDLYVQYQVELPRASSAASRLSPEERKELGRLIRKMEGRAAQSSASSSSSNVQYLQRASASDFGTASGRPEIPRDDEEDEGPFGGNPFARGSSSFFYSSGFGGSPFSGMNPEDMFREAPQTDDQCRQM